MLLTRRVVAPTTGSVLSDSVSFPIRIPKRSIKKRTVPICLSLVFGDSANII